MCSKIFPANYRPFFNTANKVFFGFQPIYSIIKWLGEHFWSFSLRYPCFYMLGVYVSSMVCRFCVSTVLITFRNVAQPGVLRGLYILYFCSSACLTVCILFGLFLFVPFFLLLAFAEPCLPCYFRILPSHIEWSFWWQYGCRRVDGSWLCQGYLCKSRVSDE